MRARLTPDVMRLEAFGVIALASWMVWVLGSTIVHHGTWRDAGIYVGAAVLVATGWLIGKWLRSKELRRVVLLVVSIVCVLLVSVTFFGGAGGGPTGYSNANAALGLQLAALAGVVALHAEGLERWLALAASLGSVLAVIGTESRTGIVLVLPVLAAVILAVLLRVRGRWWSLLLGGLASVGAVGGVVWLAGQSVWPVWADMAFDPVRRELWADALALWSASPILGSGPGSFREFSDLGLDFDTERAHMAVLQVASELGLVGVALFLLLVIVGFALARRGTPAACLIAAAGLSALLVHSSVDHVLEFPAVVLVAGVVVGMVSTRARSFLAGATQPADGAGS